MRSNFAGLAVGILMLSTLPGLASTVSSANSKAAPGTTPRFAVTSQPTQLFYSNGAARGGAYTSVTAGSGMSISRTLSAGMAQSAVGSGPSSMTTSISRIAVALPAHVCHRSRLQPTTQQPHTSAHRLCSHLRLRTLAHSRSRQRQPQGSHSRSLAGHPTHALSHEHGYGVRITFPVVLRPSRSR